MDRVDAIKRAFLAELDARRVEIDSDQPLDSVSVILRLLPDGRVMDVVFRTEGRRVIGRTDRRRVA